jgi:hypothetical protein
VSVRAIRIEAERHVAQRIQALRERVVTMVAGGGSLKGVGGQSLRSRVESEIEFLFKELVNESEPYIRQAIDAGIDRASQELGKKLTVGRSSISRDTASYRSVLRAGLKQIESETVKTVLRLLSRASLYRLTLDQVVTQLSTRSSKGTFDKAKAQSAALISEEVTDAEADAHDARLREISGNVQKEQDFGTAPKRETKKGDALIPVVISIWRHSKKGNPRPHHLAMDGTGIIAMTGKGPTGNTFLLVGRDGTRYRTAGPRQDPLPIGETINCHCQIVSKPLFLTQSKLDKLIEETVEAGGIKSTLWK